MFMVSLVSAQPPFEQGSFLDGFEIKHPIIETLQVNQDVEFEFHVFNSSNGVPIIEGIGQDTLSCYFHLYNSTGQHMLELQENTPSHNFDYGFNVTGGNFSSIGEYSYITQCNSSVAGGFVSVPFIVTGGGVEMTTATALIYIIFILTLGFLLFYTLVAAVRIPFKNTVSEEGKVLSVNYLKYFKVIMMFFSYFLLMFLIGIVRSVMYNYLLVTGAEKVFEWLWWTMFYLIWPIIVTSLIVLLITFLTDRKLTSALERGIPIR